MDEHLFRGVEVRDHAVAQRPHRPDVGRRPPEHLVRLRPDGLNRSLGGVEGDNRRLVEHDAPPLREDAGVGGAEVDGEVGGEH